MAAQDCDMPALLRLSPNAALRLWQLRIRLIKVSGGFGGNMPDRGS